MLSSLSFHLDWFGPLIKGNRILLIEDGQIQENGMRAASITRRELDQALRGVGSEPDPAQVKLAFLERNGSSSVVPRENKPRVLNVSVENGVQSIRIALE